MKDGMFDLPAVIEQAKINFHAADGMYADVGLKYPRRCSHLETYGRSAVFEKGRELNVHVSECVYISMEYAHVGAAAQPSLHNRFPPVLAL